MESGCSAIARLNIRFDFHTFFSNSKFLVNQALAIIAECERLFIF